MALNPRDNPIGHRFTELDQTGSTNELARQWIEGNLALHGDVLFTWDQTAGKGQRGKSWLSAPRQNLAMSILLENAHLPDPTPFHLSACCAIACQKILTTITNGDALIKWPNDLYWKSRKLGGMLIETQPAWSIVGIGININQTAFSASLPNPVSLRQITGKEFDPKALATQIISALNLLVKQWQADGFKPLLQEYRSLLFGKANCFSVRENGIEKSVVVVDVDENGGLILEEQGERRTVVSGIEWILRP